jgi:hypothetical protein
MIGGQFKHRNTGILGFGGYAHDNDELNTASSLVFNNMQAAFLLLRA